MASGGKVIEDPKIWAQLKDMGVRKILALEVEAATIATVAHEREVPQWLIAKGVMDHANFDKDDRFKEFAARASAEVLFALLGELLDGTPPVPTTAPAGHPGTVKVAFSQRLSHDWQDLADPGRHPRLRPSPLRPRRRSPRRVGMAGGAQPSRRAASHRATSTMWSRSSRSASRVRRNTRRTCTS